MSAPRITSALIVILLITFGATITGGHGQNTIPPGSIIQIRNAEIGYADYAIFSRTNYDSFVIGNSAAMLLLPVFGPGASIGMPGMYGFQIVADVSPGSQVGIGSYTGAGVFLSSSNGQGLWGSTFSVGRPTGLQGVMNAAEINVQNDVPLDAHGNYGLQVTSSGIAPAGVGVELENQYPGTWAWALRLTGTTNQDPRATSFPSLAGIDGSGYGYLRRLQVSSTGAPFTSPRAALEVDGEPIITESNMRRSLLPLLERIQRLEKEINLLKLDRKAELK
jgi:hypothetical protein